MEKRIEVLQHTVGCEAEDYDDDEEISTGSEQRWASVRQHKKFVDDPGSKKARNGGLAKGTGGQPGWVPRDIRMSKGEGGGMSTTSPRDTALVTAPGLLARSLFVHDAVVFFSFERYYVGL